MTLKMILLVLGLVGSALLFLFLKSEVQKVSERRLAKLTLADVMYNFMFEEMDQKLSNGFDPDVIIDGEPILILAVRKSYFNDAVSLLLDHGADRTVLSSDGKTVIEEAESYRNLEALEILK